jgi:hypothetical protein
MKKKDEPTVVIPPLELAKVALAEYRCAHPDMTKCELWRLADLVATRFESRSGWKLALLREQLILSCVDLKD